MAITFEATYSKKLGLPNYSSHCFVVSLRTELSDLSQVQEESARLYSLLQRSVDSQVQAVGFLPDATTYGLEGCSSHPEVPTPVNRLNGHASKPTSSAPTAATPKQDTEPEAAWNCTDKQRDLVVKLSRQAKMQWEDVEHLAALRFDQPLRSLDRKQTSVLIEALLARREENGRASSNRTRR